MISEAIQALVGLANKAADAKQVLSDATRIVLFVGGEERIVDKNLPDRRHDVDTLEAVVALATRFAAEGHCKPVVWYSASGVQLVIDDDQYRADTATLEFSESAVWQKLAALADAPNAAWMEQGDFVRLLRIDLAGTLDPVELLEPVKRMRFTKTTDRTVGHGRESLGRDIEARTSGEREVPEQVSLAVRVHTNAGEDTRFGLDCSVEIDAERGRFRLLPLPDEIARVSNLVVASIAERLNERLPESVPCYHGSN